MSIVSIVTKGLKLAIRMLNIIVSIILILKTDKYCDELVKNTINKNKQNMTLVNALKTITFVFGVYFGSYIISKTISKYAWNKATTLCIGL